MSTTTPPVAVSSESTISPATIIKVLGSLRLTVILFALSLVIVMVGTLAQDELNMLEVKQRYFLSWIAPLHLDDFFPQAFYRHDTPIPGVIPIPGGAMIGMLLMINLVAAKATRFRIQAKGTRAQAGWGLIALGGVLAGLVISAGHSSDGLQGVPPISYQVLWAVVLASLTIFTFMVGAASSRVGNSTVRVIGYSIVLISAAFIGYCLITGFRVGDPGLRIVWQLTKGLGAGIVMLIGCLMVFGKQGGNVLLHLGVGLLMFGQFVFGDRQLEQRLTLVEGQSANTLVNLDEIELAFLQEDEQNQEIVVAPIPASMLVAAERSGELIQDTQLPVDVRVKAFYENSSLEDPKEEQNLATKGIGLEVIAREASKSGGADSEINLASAYIELLDKDSKESLGVFLVSQIISDREILVPSSTSKDLYDSVDVAGKKYEFGLKLHREVKPYWVQLEDVRQVTYSGTATPRDYSSFIRIIDPETGEDRRERVWMNNPLRYRGETFYQSNYSALPGGKEMTGIQVVRNSGWLIPYVACSITALGMLAHFMGTLTRFLRRREREAKHATQLATADSADIASEKQTGPKFWLSPSWITIGAFVLLGVYMMVPWQAVTYSMRPQARQMEFDFYTAGSIPASFRGRVMPLDSYARQALKAISNRESLPLDASTPEIKKRVAGTGKLIDTSREKASSSKLSAMQWLMEVAIDSPDLRHLKMFRIDAEEVRSELDLERRKSKLYSLNEILAKWDAVSPQVEAAMKKEPRDRSFKERKLVELDSRTRQYTLTAATFGLPEQSLQEIPAEQFEQMFPGADEQTRLLFALRQLENRMSALKSMNAPAIVSPSPEDIELDPVDPSWMAFASARFDHLREQASADDPKVVVAKPGVETFSNMINAYSENDSEAFNGAVDKHLELVAAYPVPGYRKSMVSLERWMQSNWPTGTALVLYLIALVLGLACFAKNMPRLRQGVWGALVVALLIHTIAIVCRIAITGRAPVINIYSSAVFIGWAAVLFSLVLEKLFRYGIGNVLAAAAGVLTLLVAYGLNTGDTMPVLEAVLDTQFWLATHVISVTLGYVATMVAGTLGIAYLVAGWLRGSEKTLRDLYRCCYGIACFGILFSFVGTVLGGLWADDSWGRFWGWDPKENGALLIVIWNALMLHARWDGLVGARGFSLLAIGGNIVTAWSWFGTNELGIGLHSYGFTSGVLMWLSIFIASQIAMIAVDSLFRWLRMPFGKAT
ncbi:MAG: cytochrome c biogenesis protein CcsA [Rubripirellula sp.]|nr:cytochrome c biogenesis protein CcsA [Rubripirellula sp.]